MYARVKFRNLVNAENYSHAYREKIALAGPSETVDKNVQNLIERARAHPDGAERYITELRQGFYQNLSDKYPDSGDARRIHLSEKFEQVVSAASSGLNLGYERRRYNTLNSPKIRRSVLIAALLLIATGSFLIFWFSGFLSLQDKSVIFSLSKDTNLRASKDNKFIRSPGSAPFVANSNRPDAASGGSTQGVFIVLGPEVEAAVSGKKVRVTITARTAKKSGSPLFGIAYSTAMVGNSGWRKFAPREEYSDHSFDYDVPVMTSSSGNDFIGIWADVEGAGRGIVVKDVSLKIVEPNKD